MKKTLLTMSAFAILSIQGFANPWIECGIGAMLFPKHRVGAVISNVIWDLGSTATTSAMSSPGTCEGRSAQAAMFINETYASLEEETVKGSGDHINAMLSILNCDLNKQDEIVSNIRADFSNQLINASSSQTKKAEAYYNLVTSHTSSTCTI